MNRRLSLLLCGAALALVAGCSQKPQTLTQTGAPPSQDPWMGANPAFTEKGWKVGDQASWQREIDRRAQYQNEYVRMR
ncbi:hypothetical protein [Thiomonas sp.]|jgi:hypothetical protein|uniref:hypothetical protein n=1 Tax=Thiomonas sp. TaxID=2047785 RepID=UPI00263687AE|nr:hypothetical protein [Thiomonas sp.]